MIVLTKDQAEQLKEICYELDKSLWRSGFPPENLTRSTATRYAKILTEMLRNG
jgi:hypothetical protein